MTPILVNVVVGVTCAVIAVFIYRNNTKVISPYADHVDGVWDKIALQDKIKSLEEKLDELLNKVK